MRKETHCHILKVGIILGYLSSSLLLRHVLQCRYLILKIHCIIFLFVLIEILNLSLQLPLSPIVYRGWNYLLLCTSPYLLFKEEAAK